MKAILDLSLDDRRIACEQVEAGMRLAAASVEKDFWVCWTLRELARLPGVGVHLTFKGGTSLSKGWGLIERFSEDIDLVVGRDMLGFGGDASPEAARNRSQVAKRLAALKAACRGWVQGPLLDALRTRIARTLGSSAWKLEVDPATEDGQCLLFRYPSAFVADAAGYVGHSVRIEMGARSDDWPGESRDIQPYLAQHLPVLAEGAAFAMNTLVPERTFWEKAMLLHEETFRPEGKPRAPRMARHYYDVYCLIRSGVAARAAADKDLFRRCAAHRQVFFRQNWVDYSTLEPSTLRLRPAAGHLDAWRRDYARMQGPMFFGDPPGFATILASIEAFEKTFTSAAAST